MSTKTPGRLRKRKGKRERRARFKGGCKSPAVLPFPDLPLSLPFSLRTWCRPWQKARVCRRRGGRDTKRSRRAQSPGGGIARGYTFGQGKGIGGGARLALGPVSLSPLRTSAPSLAGGTSVFSVLAPPNSVSMPPLRLEERATRKRRLRLAKEPPSATSPSGALRRDGRQAARTAPLPAHKPARAPSAHPNSTVMATMVLFDAFFGAVETRGGSSCRTKPACGRAPAEGGRARESARARARLASRPRLLSASLPAPRSTFSSIDGDRIHLTSLHAAHARDRAGPCHDARGSRRAP